MDEEKRFNELYYKMVQDENLSLKEYDFLMGDLWEDFEFEQKILDDLQFL